MTLYKLDETGEAIHVDLNRWAEWYAHVDRSTLTIARHDIIEVKEKKIGAVAIDALKHPYHDGRVLATVVTKMNANETGIDYPWQTGVIGEEPEFRTTTRKQALQGHRNLVNQQIRKYGGRVFI